MTLPSRTWLRDPPPSEALPDLRTLQLMAEIVLARLEQCALSQGVVLPGRRFTYMAEVPADCEQAVILFGGWVPFPPLEGLTHCPRGKWVGNFSAGITRCTPALPDKKGKPPSVAAMNEAAVLSSRDAEVLLCLVDSFEEIGPDVEVVTGPPLGGFQTVELNFQLPAAGGLD